MMLLSFLTMSTKHIEMERRREKRRNLVEQEIGENEVCGERVSAARAITLDAEVSENADVAETVATSREEGVFDDLHAYRAHNVLVRLLRRRFGGGAW